LSRHQTGIAKQIFYKSFYSAESGLGFLTSDREVRKDKKIIQIILLILSN
jgi:hypothetical protein